TGGLLHRGALGSLAGKLLQLLVALAARLRAEHVADGQAAQEAESIKAHLGLSRSQSAAGRTPVGLPLSRTALTPFYMPGATIVMRGRPRADPVRRAQPRWCATLIPAVKTARDR